MSHPAADFTQKGRRPCKDGASGHRLTSREAAFGRWRRVGFSKPRNLKGSFQSAAGSPDRDPERPSHGPSRSPRGCLRELRRLCPGCKTVNLSLVTRPVGAVLLQRLQRIDADSSRERRGVCQACRPPAPAICTLAIC